MNHIDEMNRRARHDRDLTYGDVRRAMQRGREKLAAVAAARAADSAGEVWRATREQAKRACAPIVAASIRAMVRPEFKHLVAPEK
jgi:hypothetical protein